MRDGDTVTVHIPRLIPGGALSLDAKGKIIRTEPVSREESKARDVVISLQIEGQLQSRLERFVDVRRVAMIRELAGSDGDATRLRLLLRRPSAI